jgi:arylsulfatase
MRPRRRNAWPPLAWIGLLALPACSRPEARVLLDLAAELPVAELEAPIGCVRFGFPVADSASAEGLFRGAGADGERLAWARREARIEIELAERSPREAILELAPHPDVSEQAADVLLNDRHVGRLLFRGRVRHRLRLPETSQFAGRNVLMLRFDRLGSRHSPQGRRLAASVHWLLFGPEGDPRLDVLARSEAPGLVEARGGASARELLQAIGTRLHYALPAGPAAVLRFGLDRHSLEGAATGSVRARVRLATSSAEVRELWEGPPEGGGEQGLALPALTAAARLTLAVDAPGDGHGTWARWRRPRLTGPAPRAVREDGRVAGLRGELRGANVVLVVLDAAAAGHVSAYGYPRQTTPEIDRLAREGVLLESAYTAAPYTIGAMSSLWTSRHPDELSSRAANARLATHHPVLAELLSAHGILTAGFVANSFAGTAFALDRGFSEFHEKLGADAAELARTAATWIEAHAGRRFFLYVHFREPHFPFDPPPPFDSRFGPGGPLPRSALTEMAWISALNQGAVRPSAKELDHLVRRYDGNLAFADQGVGALRRSLEAAGLLERTLLIVTADHGEAFYEHAFVGHNQQLYEESLAVPLVLRIPAPQAPRGARHSALADLLDVAPTVADVMGVMNDPRSGAFRGKSLLPVVLGRPGKAFAIARNVTPQRPAYALRDGRWSWIRDTATGGEQLFDLSSDPQEAHDLSAQQPLECLLRRQHLFRFLAGLNQPADDAVRPALTPEQRENLRALGYLE